MCLTILLSTPTSSQNSEMKLCVCVLNSQISLTRGSQLQTYRLYSVSKTDNQFKASKPQPDSQLSVSSSKHSQEQKLLVNSEPHNTIKVYPEPQVDGPVKATRDISTHRHTLIFTLSHKTVYAHSIKMVYTYIHSYMLLIRP